MNALALTGALVVFASLAAAEPPPPNDERTAGDVAGAPRPGLESGLAAPADPGDSLARLFARGALFVPRVVTEVAFLPFQLGARIVERYQLVARWKRWFFDDSETIGLVPTVSIQSGFGATFGARLVHRDLFGHGERVSVRTSAGGRYRQLHRASFQTGELLGPQLALEARAEYERRPREPFYGIGSGDEMMPPGELLSITGPREARYRHAIARATVVADARLTSALHARISGELADHHVSADSSADALDRVYAVEDLVGFGPTQRAYGELELRLDTRRGASRWEPPALLSEGSLVAVFVGRSAAIGSGADYWRYGIDLQHLVRLAVGPRVLAFRGYAEAVSRGRDAVPFFELAQLGGTAHLRGYAADRFRDRAAAVASVEYQWDLARHLSASLFVDVGRVFPGIRDVSLERLRVGYGVGLQAHTARSFIARVSVASSTDGGVFLDLSLDPFFELDRRVER